LIWLPLVFVMAGDSTGDTVTNPDSMPGPWSDSATIVTDASDSLGSPDSLEVRRMATTIVKGERRFRREEEIDRTIWSKPAPMGLPGALEALREQPGVAFSGDLSGRFSALGMPMEGSAVTWDGAPILWPWHFGGLFGVLDDWAVGEVDWRANSDAASPAHGGGWLETRSRAWSDSDQVHAAARLGFVAGGAAAWGRRGDWGWQFCARRTWLDYALGLARDRGWTEQEMDVRFQDAAAVGSWRHGAWKASVGWFGSEDSLGIGLAEGSDPLGISWRNIAIPVGIDWREGPWKIGMKGSWSRYRRVDSDLPSADTLVRKRMSIDAGHAIGAGAVLEFGASLDAYESTHRVDEGKWTEGWFGDSEALVLQQHVGIRQRGADWECSIWAGGAKTSREIFAPQVGFAASRETGDWVLEVSGERRIVPLSTLDQSRRQLEAVSPAWILVPGDASRTTGIHGGASRRSAIGAEGWNADLRASGWVRIHEGAWDWELVEDRTSVQDRWEVSRSDGWSAGLEIGGGISSMRLDLQARQILSMDVLRRRPQDGWSYPSRWAPWDQRWRTELRGSWSWIGSVAGKPGVFSWNSDLVYRISSGVLRSKLASGGIVHLDQPANSSGIIKANDVFARHRTPYFRLDLTPVRIGREGRWSFWWTLVNVTNETNLLGWADDRQDARAEPISQIPFLPVVFGAQIEI